MSYLALISVIENMVDYEGKLNGFKAKPCSKCSAPIYSLGKRFRDFMIKYCEQDSQEFMKYLKKLYSKRSHITHIGELLYNDYADTDYDVRGVNELNTLKVLVRTALYNWILKSNSAEPS